MIFLFSHLIEKTAQLRKLARNQTIKLAENAAYKVGLLVTTKNIYRA